MSSHAFLVLLGAAALSRSQDLAASLLAKRQSHPP